MSGKLFRCDWLVFGELRMNPYLPELIKENNDADAQYWIEQTALLR